MEALDKISPWQVKGKEIADLTNNSMRTIKSNYKTAKLAFEIKFAEALGPEQSSVLAGMLFDDVDDILDKVINENLKAIKNIHKSSVENLPYFSQHASSILKLIL